MLSLFLVSTCLFAQTTTGSIVGIVTDSHGSVLPGVKVSVIDEGTGAVRSLNTDASGAYVATLLPIGLYTVKVERAAFKLSTVTGIRLNVQQTVRINITMQVGQVTQSVNVTSATPLLKTDVSDVGTVIGQRQVVELPLNGRNFLQLATLVPGTISVARTDQVLPSYGGGIQTNGADTNGNDITLDGIDNQELLVNRVGVKVSLDATAEFKVMTANYSAQYGRAAGAIISVVTKSGTNELHGDVYDFLRNSSMMSAKNFFATTVPPLRQNQFGATAGGPIIKNKTFFFGAYEGLRSATGLTIKATVPTAAQRAGNLAGGDPIYDPLTIKRDPVTGIITRTPFPGNVIPVNRISQQAINALNLLYPTAQQQIPNVFNSIFNPLATDNYNQYLGRIDHHLSAKDLLFGRYVWMHESSVSPNQGGGGLPGQGTALDLTTQNLALGYTRIFNSNIVNELRLGYNRYFQYLHAVDQSDIVGKIGINGAMEDPRTWGPPVIAITNMTTAAAFQYSPSRPVSNDFQFVDTLSVVRGPHTLTMGADIRRSQLNGGQFTHARGTYIFGGGFTNDPESPSTTGQGFADFLLGYPTSTSVTIGSTNNDLRGLNEGFYVQDDWNIRPNLTLNLGLRYDFMPQPVSARDRMSAWNDATHSIVTAQTNPNAIPHCPGCGNQTLAELEQGYAGIFKFNPRTAAKLSPALINNDYNGWAPRVGFAWRLPGGQSVLRGGWGRFYELEAGNIQWNYTGQAPYSKSLAFSANTLALPTFTLTNPFPSTSVVGAPGVGGSMPEYRNPHNDNWNLTFQTQLRPGVTAQIGYVGARANNQFMYVDFNSPKFGIANVQSLRPDPKIGSTAIDTTWGHSWYDALQATFAARVRSLNLTANYSWGHAITVGGGGINQTLSSARLAWNFLGFRTPVLAGNLPASDPYLAIDKGPAAMDIRHIFSLSYVWDLPFGSGRLVNLSGPLNVIAGGWELTGITSIQSGFPIPISCAQSCSRPDLLGNPNTGAPHKVNEWFNTSPNLYRTPPSSLAAYNAGLNPLVTIGTAGRAPILGPGTDNWDMGVYKNFSVAERYRVQFRAEFFNVWNHPNFDGPNTTYGSPVFGRISSAEPARVAQLGLKLYY